MLVHSFIYYRLGTSIVSDQQFDKWARELVELQRAYPEEAAKCIYAKEFATFDGTTGFDLPYEPWIEHTARTLLGNHKRWCQD